ncbi:MAG TPA: hypothetical protein VKU37_06375 [Verrucomicrobiae bacterium]|nr:hypothetical protein [Verrucomicrobiae bacterium]
MIDNLPVKAVMRAVMVQCHMIEDDLARGRIPSNPTTTSLLSFCVFLNSATHGSPDFFPELPIEHWAFYGKIVRKLVAAGELELKAQDQFDTAFSKSLLRPAVSKA